MDVSYVGTDGASVDTRYVVPNRNQCAGCHAKDGESEPLGAVTRQLNRPLDSTPQLEHLASMGVVSGVELEAAPAFVDPSDASADLELRARAYLHSNCGHCHRE